MTQAAGILRLAPKVVDKSRALEVLDSLRAMVASGEVVAFAAVGIEPDDCTRYWQASTAGTSNLRVMGALYSLLHSFKDDM